MHYTKYRIGYPYASAQSSMKDAVVVLQPVQSPGFSEVYDDHGKAHKLLKTDRGPTILSNSLKGVVGFLIQSQNDNKDSIAQHGMIHGQGSSMQLALVLGIYARYTRKNKNLPLLLFSAAIKTQDKTPDFVDAKINSYSYSDAIVHSLLSKYKAAQMAQAKALIIPQNDAKLLAEHSASIPIFYNINELKNSHPHTIVLGVANHSLPELAKTIGISPHHYSSKIRINRLKLVAILFCLIFIAFYVDYLIKQNRTQLFVSNSADHSIKIFTISSSDDIYLQRVLQGPNTALNYPRSTFIKKGELFVSNTANSSITVFNQHDHGNTPPKRVIRGARTAMYSPALIFVTSTEIFVPNFNGNRITVFNKNDEGNVLPKRMIEGPITKVSRPLGVFVTAGELFVTNFRNRSITVFNEHDQGSVSPKRFIQGSATSLHGPEGIFVANGEIFVANTRENSILIFNQFDHGNVTPKRIIKGKNTGLGLPKGLCVAKQRIFSINVVGSLVVFDQNDHGNIIPQKNISKDLFNPHDICTSIDLDSYFQK